MSTYWANTLKIRAMPLEIWKKKKKKSNQSLEVDFSYRVRLPLFSTPRADPMLSSKYFWRAANLSKSMTWSRGRSSFAAKLPVCFAEVRISSADPAVVIQAEHLESLSQTASPCDVVS